MYKSIIGNYLLVCSSNKPELKFIELNNLTIHSENLRDPMVS